jgi:hypothetical protein
MGILPQNFYPVDINLSFNTDYACEHDHNGNAQSGFKLTIDENNKYYAIWCSIDVINRILSAFFYAEIATLSSADPGEVDFILMLILESFFLISLTLKFFITYIPEGETIPVTEILSTA